MPGTAVIRAAADGGPLKGGAPRVVWQALGADPRVVSAKSAAQRLNDLGRSGHLVWNPVNGEIVQLIPIVRAGRSLGWPEGLDPPSPAGLCGPPGLPGEAERGAVPGYPHIAGPDRLAEINSEGRLCVQICVVAFAWQPFTSGPMAGLQAILDWLDSWGVPRNWPAGRPAPFPHGHASSRSRRLWSRGGHFGASQVPDWTAAGPGAVDVGRLTGQAAGQVAAAVPAARTAAPGDSIAAQAGLGDLGMLDDDAAAGVRGAPSLTRPRERRRPPRAPQAPASAACRRGRGPRAEISASPPVITPSPACFCISAVHNMLYERVMYRANAQAAMSGSRTR
jgi:hypothetical protein